MKKQIIILSMLVCAASAETITLNDGRIVSGEITKKTPDKITVITSTGIENIPTSNLSKESVAALGVPDPKSADEMLRRMARLEKQIADLTATITGLQNQIQSQAQVNIHAGTTQSRAAMPATRENMSELLRAKNTQRQLNEVDGVTIIIDNAIMQRAMQVVAPEYKQAYQRDMPQSRNVTFKARKHGLRDYIKMTWREKEESYEAEVTVTESGALVFDNVTLR